MNGNGGTLVVGIGSVHGDDQAGWQVVDSLRALQGSGADLRKAAVPHDILDWIGQCRQLHVVDAWAQGQDVRRIDVNLADRPFDLGTRSESSHRLGIDRVLHLAAALGKLPERVVVWMIPAQDFARYAQISEKCSMHVDTCATRLGLELRDA